MSRAFTSQPPPNNTVGAKLSELKDGDRVTVKYADDWANQMGPVNAMILKKGG